LLLPPQAEYRAGEMSAWIHALECVLVPCVIGASMFGVFELWDRTRRRRKDHEGLPVIDYTI
jgi:hypothetical protein